MISEMMEGRDPPKITAEAMKTLHEAAEVAGGLCSAMSQPSLMLTFKNYCIEWQAYTSRYLVRAGMIALYAGRRTTDGEDVRFLQMLLGTYDSDVIIPAVRRRRIAKTPQV